MATPVKRKDEMKAGRSPKLSMPMARAPSTTVKLSQDRKGRSLAKKTLGSTRVGSAIRLPVWEGWVSREVGYELDDCGDEPGAVWRRGWLDMARTTV
jgi:hypothetical protein